MDFVDGESLLNLVEKRGALAPAEALGYIQQIGKALIVVHQAGLVHRDAHPDNIMIQKNGKAVLIDFGIAACIAVFPVAFVAGTIRGIPFFWQLIDCSFGLVGGLLLLYCKRVIARVKNIG
jgi:serine/threonine protein kinase